MRRGCACREPRSRAADRLAESRRTRRAPAAAARICNWDEDALTLAVEAATAARCDGWRSGERIDALSLASTTLPFADRDNAALVAAALDLPGNLETLSCHVEPAVRARARWQTRRAVAMPATLVVASDADERLSPAVRRSFLWSRRGGDAGASRALGGMLLWPPSWPSRRSPRISWITIAAAAISLRLRPRGSLGARRGLRQARYAAPLPQL